MRLSYIIRSINASLATSLSTNATNGTPSLAERPECRSPARLGAACEHVLCLVVAAYTLVLMVIGYLVSGLLLRQMEYNTDRYEARVVRTS